MILGDCSETKSRAGAFERSLQHIFLAFMRIHHGELPTTMTNRVRSVEIKEMDVLMGRGGDNHKYIGYIVTRTCTAYVTGLARSLHRLIYHFSASSHSRNQRLRELAWAQREAYRQASKTEKSRIVNDILQQICGRGGRYVTVVKSRSQSFVDSPTEQTPLLRQQVPSARQGQRLGRHDLYRKRQRQGRAVLERCSQGQVSTCCTRT